MRLFAIREYKRGPLIRDQAGNVMYFTDKMEAKRYRDGMPAGAVVTFGPDHKLFKGE